MAKSVRILEGLRALIEIMNTILTIRKPLEVSNDNKFTDEI